MDRLSPQTRVMISIGSSAEAANAPSKGGLAGWQRRRIERCAAADVSDMTVAALAAMLGLSRHHFSRAFQASFGTPPREWLLRVRLADAERRLRHGHETVEQIAIDLGYRSGSQFARAFRARFGCSPTAYRRR